MGIKFISFAAALLPMPALAITTNCVGLSKDWTLAFTKSGATYQMRGKTFDMSIAHTAVATPGPWPVALTLLGPRDTAIALIIGYDDAPETVELLTQDRGIPVVLSGECREPSVPEFNQ